MNKSRRSFLQTMGQFSKVAAVQVIMPSMVVGGTVEMAYTLATTENKMLTKTQANHGNKDTAAIDENKNEDAPKESGKMSKEAFVVGSILGIAASYRFNAACKDKNPLEILDSIEQLDKDEQLQDTQTNDIPLHNPQS